MARFYLPKSDAETPNRAAGPFPAGVWEGTIDTSRVRVLTRDEEADFLLKIPERGVASGEQAYFAEIAEIASLQLGNNKPLVQGQAEVGAQKLFDDGYYLSIDGVNWDEDFESRELAKFARSKLLQTRRRLTNLARNLGLVDIQGDSVGPVDDFDSMLRNNELAGRSVRYRVAHTRPQKRADGSTPEPRAYVEKYE